MKIKIYTAKKNNDVNNVLCKVDFQFDSISIARFQYRAYRCTDKFIGTNCMSLLKCGVAVKWTTQLIYVHTCLHWVAMSCSAWSTMSALLLLHHRQVMQWMNLNHVGYSSKSCCHPRAKMCESFLRIVRVHANCV